MKTKALPSQTNAKKRFFLLMIVPVLIGLMMTLTNFAHAEWNTKDDPLLHKSPTNQGWTQIQTHGVAAGETQVNLPS